MKKIKYYSLILLTFTIILFTNSIYAEDLPAKYNLKDHINIEVRDQRSTNTCWAFALSSMLSNHLALVNNEYYTFSPRHVEYTMSEDSILNYENRYAYENKTLEIGGNENILKKYLIQGTGPVLEKNMPFKDDAKPISIAEYPTDLAYKQVTSAAHIFPMYKEWQGASLIYKDYKENVINKEKVLEYQNKVKQAIKQYGGVEASIKFEPNYYDNNNGAYNNKTENGYWHSILLVGWDDNYSKDNFSESSRPLTNGAYIALNSWGDYTGDDGYIYISYEDVTLDMATKTYIKKIENINYDKVYSDDLYEAKQNGEILTELSIMVDSCITGYAYIDLTVNGSKVISHDIVEGCIENFVLKTPIQLNKDTDIELEISVPDEFKKYIIPYYYTITNKSQFEVGNLEVNNLNNENKELYIYTKHNVVDNGKTVDVKVLNGGVDKTSDFNIAGNIIKNNQTGITISAKNTAYKGDYDIKFIYNNEEITRTFSLANGKIVQIENSGNTSVDVLGDISLDGKVTVTDLSQLKSHMTGLSNLSEESIKKCDLNKDGVITVTDLARLKMILVGM